MKRYILLSVAATVVVAALHSDAFGRGFGGFGGFHGGGGFGGFHAGGYGGFHSGGFGGESGGFHDGGFEGGGYRAGGSEFGGYHAGGFDSGGYRASAYGGSVDRSQLGGFLGMPTDGGMHAASGAYGSRAAVAGPEGFAAGRGIAAGPGGVNAGRGYASAYGTRYWSPTYCHAQGLAADRWCSGAGPFTPGWCGAHAWGWCPAGYTAAAWANAAWDVPTAAALGSWIGSTSAYAPYDYGDNVTYQNDYVYYGTQPYATQQQYYRQAATIAASQPSVAADRSDENAKWLPLGVFGLVAEGQKTPSMVFQLAVDKAGVIRGNYYDQISDTTIPVTGAVDKKEQRVAWRVGKNKKMVIETALYNLTQKSSTALVHDGPDQTQQYALVQMKKPQGQQQP